MTITKVTDAGLDRTRLVTPIIINGDMSVAQRATSVTGQTGAGIYTVDRMRLSPGGGMTFTVAQASESPTGQGFTKSYKLTSTTGDSSMSSSEYNIPLQMRMEGNVLQSIRKGTSNAQKITFAFWVYATVTGTYVLELSDDDNSRYNSQSYTISSASTWEKKIVTFPADTTGAFDNDNASSLECEWFLGAGSTYTSGAVPTSWEAESAGDRAAGLTVNLGDSTSNEWYITGVQLEAGQVASDFEFLPIDVNLERCKRYFQTKGTSLSPNAFTNNQTVAMGLARTVSQAQCYMELNPIMRSEPTVSGIGTLSNLKCHTATGGNVNTSSIGSDGTPNRQQVTYLANNLTSGLNDNQPIRLYGDYTITFDAEL